MRGTFFVPRATRGLLAAAIGLAAAGAQASTPATVDPETQVSTLNLPHVQALFDPVPHTPGYGGYFSINGQDYSFENHAVIDNVIEPGAEGLSFASYHATSTGIVEATPTGYHTWPGASIDLTLYNIGFVAKDGYRIDSLQLEITATTSVTGSGSASVEFDPQGQTTTSTDSATGVITHRYTRTFDGTSTGDVHVGLNSAVDDSQGVAKASAILTGFKLTAQISAVPEPSTWAMIGIGGALAAGWARRGRKG
jgi:hypothetical protein